MHNYKLAIREAPLIDHYRFDEARAEILAGHNEEFRGNPNIADTREYQYWQPLTHSNTFRALSYHALARQLGILEIPVLSFEDNVRFWPYIFERDSTYGDTREIGIFPNPHENPDNESLRRGTLDLLDIKDTDVPLIVSGLVPKRDDSNSTYGAKVVGSQDLIANPAPFLEHDCKVRWDGEKIVECGEGEEGIQIHVPDSQSGIRRLVRGRSGGLGARDGGLLGSVGSGRVQFLYQASRAENLETMVKQRLTEEAERRKAEIDARLHSALQYLLTGEQPVI